MTKEEAIHFAECLKNNWTINFADMEEFCDMVIEALYKPTSDDLIIKGAKGIQDGLYNIQNGELFQYKAKGGTVRTYPIVEALQDDWIPLSDDSIVPDYEVMCQGRYGNMMFGYASVDEYGIWMCEDDNTIMDDVVAWRHKPEPYKGGDRE